MSEPKVVSSCLGAVQVIRINDPERMNALSGEVHDLLREAIADARKPTVRAVVLTGTGPAFSAGGDIGRMEATTRTATTTRNHMKETHQTLTKPLFELEKPTIAAVNGVVAGGALGLALACDLRVASTNSRFVFAFSKIALVPDFGTAYFLPRLLGLARAKQFAFLDQKVDANQALTWGLVNEVVPDEDCLSRATSLAQELAAGPPTSLELTKRILNRGVESSLDAMLDLEAAYMAIAGQSTEHVRAREAFLASHRKG